MQSLFFGIAGFVLCYLYEAYTVYGRFSALRLCFFIGTALIFSSTVFAAVQAIYLFEPVIWRAILFGLVAALFFALLIYSLFFAVPFAKTYVETEGKQAKKVCKHGVYALCRHPGVLWFIAFYGFLWLALGGKPLFWQFIIYSILNLIYIIIQDNWSFLVCFADYSDYKKSVPFLIPTKKSIKNCMKHFCSKKGEV